MHPPLVCCSSVGNTHSRDPEPCGFSAPCSGFCSCCWGTGWHASTRWIYLGFSEPRGRGGSMVVMRRCALCLLNCAHSTAHAMAGHQGWTAACNSTPMFEMAELPAKPREHMVPCSGCKPCRLSGRRLSYNARKKAFGRSPVFFTLFDPLIQAGGTAASFAVRRSCSSWHRRAVPARAARAHCPAAAAATVALARWTTPARARPAFLVLALPPALHGLKLSQSGRALAVAPTITTAALALRRARNQPRVRA